jgi:hypothetical protein
MKGCFVITLLVVVMLVVLTLALPLVPDIDPFAEDSLSAASGDAPADPFQIVLEDHCDVYPNDPVCSKLHDSDLKEFYEVLGVEPVNDSMASTGDGMVLDPAIPLAGTIETGCRAWRLSTFR